MEPLDVAVACNGLKMLMTLAATVTADGPVAAPAGVEADRPAADRRPIAMISNMVRIVTTAWCYYYMTGEHAKEWATTYPAG